MFWSGSNAVRGPGAKAPTDSPRAKINSCWRGKRLWLLADSSCYCRQAKACRLTSVYTAIACILRAAKSAGRTCRIAGKTINSCVFLPLCRCVSSVGTSACEENGQDFGENRVREPEGRKLLVLYTRFGGRIASDGGLGG